MKMKKLFCGMMMTAAMMTAAAGTAMAAPAERPACFVDADNNGICDNCNGTGKGRENGNGKGTGIRPQDGTGRRCGFRSENRGQGANFVDANKDGICDNYGTRGRAAQN